MRETDKRVPLGRVSGVHGIKGWIKVHSYTEPRENIAQFDSWLLEQRSATRRVEVKASSSGGKAVLVKLAGIDDRDAAHELVGAQIAVERAELPPCGPGEYYWTDLEGLSVRNEIGETLGTVEYLLGTGAQDVLVLEGGRGRLIPFVVGVVVKRIDLEAGVIVVDWDPSYWE